jgi:hypothetical protein
VTALVQIFRNLSPHDLLHMSRASKALRAVILHRNARVLWIEALKSVPDLPACLDEVSEPTYTKLAFDTYCSVRYSFEPMEDTNWQSSRYVHVRTPGASFGSSNCALVGAV